MSEGHTTETFMRILLVDDEENILRSFTRLLGDENFEVITANSGDEALEVLKHNEEIGLIISDQNMPGLSGADFLGRARKAAPYALRMMLTGDADIQTAADAINKGGAHRYITKPWNNEEVIQIIRDAAQRYSLMRENKNLIDTVREQNEKLKQLTFQLQHKVREKTRELERQNQELQGLNQRLESNFKSTIGAMVGLIELRDKRVTNHSNNVAQISADIVRQLNLPHDEGETIAAAAILHDIGKIGMPDVLLTKDMEEMNLEERNEYKIHPVRGQTAIASVESLRKAGVLVRHHHERYDGKGFPDALKGTSIPLGSRIITLANFIDRIIGKYQGDNPIEFALRKVREEAGKRFDHRLCNLVKDVVKGIYTKTVPKKGMEELELAPENLQVGMVLSRNVRSGTGILLLSGGNKLSKENILALRDRYRLDPPENGVFVWVQTRK